MENVAKIKLGLVAVSRDCFPKDLSRKRRDAVALSCEKKGIEISVVNTIIENEKDVLKALDEIKKAGINSLCIYLGNFGPEGPLSILAQKFAGPVMLVAASEESGNELIQGRGDAYCGMLNASYSFGLRKILPYIPEYPVGNADEVASMIGEFVPVARVVVSLRSLKIFSFGPRPQDFYACNAPIARLFDLGVEIMENSELDLYDIYKSASRRSKAITSIAEDMAKELGSGNTYPDMLKNLAQYELALTDFYENNKGASQYAVFANKCWPSFEKYFGFTPCYVNSRLAAKGIPVSCEVDIFGTLSEYMATAATMLPATILDINNTVPSDMYNEAKNVVGNYKNSDLFMGFHCGNTASSCMINASMRYQLIMHRLMEGVDKEPNITRGTYEGRIKSSDITLFRLQSTADTTLRAYIAEGEVLDIDPKSFGSIGVFAVKEMGRFYRHVLIEKQYPHHAAIAFKHTGKTLFSALKMLGIADIGYNQPKEIPYPNENPFA